MDLTQIMMDIFGPYGTIGVVLMVFLAFYIDATFVPFLPEIFIIVGFSYSPTPEFAIILLICATIAEILGNTTLYLLVKHFMLPQKIKDVINRYVGFLIVSDERMMLLNRIAPIVPYSGAFIGAVESWKYSKCMFYLVVGCILKYGLILSMSSVFYAYFTSDVAQWCMIGFVFLILAISFLASYIRKRKTLGEV